MGKVTKVEVPLPADDLLIRACVLNAWALRGTICFAISGYFVIGHSLFPCTISIMIAMEPCDD